MNLEHYETLGIEPDATQDEIKAAYRRKSKEHHPDRNGGSNEAMQAVNEAYEVLSDPERRDRYDRGEDDEFEQTVRGHIIGLFASILAQDLDGRQRVGDYIREARLNLKELMVAKQTQLTASRRRKERLSAMIGRVESTDREDLFGSLVMREIAQCDLEISSLMDDITVAEAIMERVKKYKDKMADITEMQFPSTAATFYR